MFGEHSIILWETKNKLWKEAVNLCFKRSFWILLLGIIPAPVLSFIISSLNALPFITRHPGMGRTELILLVAKGKYCVFVIF